MGNFKITARSSGNIREPLTAEEEAKEVAKNEDWVARTDERHNQRTANDLKGMDPHTTRVFHDLVDVLVDKGTIALTDLPQAAQDKLAAQKAKRDQLR